ncbi:MAG: acyl-CoA dehydrogenase family protein [Acidimicrobiia bacterium]
MALTGAELAEYDATRRLARERLAAAAEAGPKGRLDRTLIAALAEAGLVQRIFPSSHGGTQPGEVSAFTLCLLREAVAVESSEAETALAMQGLGAYPVLQSGRPEIASRWIPAIARGEAVPAFALTEPDAGSDAAAIALAAERDGNGWRLTGEKTWISNAPDADVYTVFARTTPGAGAAGVTAFAVPGDVPGLSGRPLDLVAPHPVGSLVFDGVLVPDDHRLGELDGGFAVAMRTLDRFRPSVGAFAVGIAQAALEAAIAHAGTRHAFGGPLRELQAVAHKLADMATSLHAARLVVYDAARAFDAGAEPLTIRASMAKLLATETAQRVVDDAIQIHGARALEVGHLLERLYRDVRAPRIYEGASEVQRTIIARRLYPRA